MVVERQVSLLGAEDSAALCNVEGWGRPYSSADACGHMIVHAGGPGTPPIDLRALVEEIVERGIAAPTLLRFPEILRERLTELNEAFLQAIEEYGYRATYRGVYPIKINQEQTVVEHPVRYGQTNLPPGLGIMPFIGPKKTALNGVSAHPPRAWDGRSMKICQGIKGQCREAR